MFEKDSFTIPGESLEITFIGHGTLIIEYNGTVIHIDPWTALADYGPLPDADLILITHEHHDHLDLSAINQIRKEKTLTVTTETCAGQLGKRAGDLRVMKNGDSFQFGEIGIVALPAYNFTAPFHPGGKGNGYLLTLGSRKIYIAGDTENTPEMKALKGIDIAFLPMNLPYTMTPAQVADGARAFDPKVLYPYHYGETDTSELTELLKDSDIDVRIRKLS